MGTFFSKSSTVHKPKIIQIFIQNFDIKLYLRLAHLASLHNHSSSFSRKYTSKVHFRFQTHLIYFFLFFFLPKLQKNKKGKNRSAQIFFFKACIWTIGSHRSGKLVFLPIILSILFCVFLRMKLQNVVMEIVF